MHKASTPSAEPTSTTSSNSTAQYPEAITVKLEQNYRSTQNIVGAANSIIRHNKEQIEKTVYSENDPGEQILVMPAATDKEAAAKVTGTIGRLHRREEVPYDEIAILYRTNAQSRSFEDALREHNIPYRIYGGMSFYQRKENQGTSSPTSAWSPISTTRKPSNAW